jgi:multidrug efflux pump
MRAGVTPQLIDSTLSTCSASARSPPSTAAQPVPRGDGSGPAYWQSPETLRDTYVSLAGSSNLSPTTSSSTPPALSAAGKLNANTAGANHLDGGFDADPAGGLRALRAHHHGAVGQP